MEMYGIRWEQRFSNFKKALKKLEESVGFIKENFLDKEESILSELVKQGLIQGFEFTHELAWNVMKDYLTYQGNFEIRGSRDATREGFSMGLISDGEIWMEMIKSRNQPLTRTMKQRPMRFSARSWKNICRHSSRLKSRWSQFGIENKAN